MQLHFRKFGEGKPVVILHGLLGSSDNLQTFAKSLANTGYCVYTPDLRNHGLSPHADSMSHKVLADDVYELFKSENLGETLLIGHSLGGKTAMTFAYAHPENISGLVIIDISPRKYSVHHRKILDTLLQVDLSVVKTRKEVEQILNSNLDEQSEIQFLLKNLYWKEKEQLGWRFNLNAINAQIEEVGKATMSTIAFQKPTLFIRGEKSDYITYEDEREIFELFENVEVKTAPGSGHWVHADNLEWLLQVVSEFQSKIQ
jgi:esterase